MMVLKSISRILIRSSRTLIKKKEKKQVAIFLSIKPTKMNQIIGINRILTLLVSHLKLPVSHGQQSCYYVFKNNSNT